MCINNGIRFIKISNDFIYFEEYIKTKNGIIRNEFIISKHQITK